MNACRHCGRTGTGYRTEPSGYVAWFDWAASMTRQGWQQVPCPGCGCFTLWVEKKGVAA